MNKLEEIQQIASQIRLVLDNPQSVKLQVKQIRLATIISSWYTELSK